MFFPIKDYNPTKKTAYLTIFLILVNVIVFLYQNLDFVSGKSANYFIMRSAMIPWEVTHFKNLEQPIGYQEFNTIEGRFRENVYREIPPLLSLFYSLFMHGSIWHLGGNMLFLWIFGNNIEDYLGRIKFIFFYLLAGLCASFVHIIFNINSLVPVIGASGAVSGIMGAYLVLYPHAKVRTLVFIFFIITFMDIPAFVFLFVWFIFQFFYAGGGSGIAWLAHIGGFLFGFFIIKRLKKKPVIEVIQ